jgi:hypothetical protein
VSRRLSGARWWVGALLALAACGSATTSADAGPDGGLDAGPPLTDGGALGTPCSSLDECAGNPICPLTEACPEAVICASQQCASAGGPVASPEIALTLDVTLLPSYVEISLLAPELVAGGTLSCASLFAGLDAGTLAPDLTTEVNPLVLPYAQSAEGASKSAPFDFALQASASGPGRVLFLEGFLRATLEDGGDELVGMGCTSFDDSVDAGDVGVVLNAP